jgi:hypothetical protein
MSSAPNLTFTVEPSLSGAVVYGPLAAGTAFGEQAAQLSIRVWIKNNEAAAVVISTIALSFVPPPLVDPVAISVNLSIGPGETKLWNFATADNIILPEPPPPTFTLSAWCNGFSDPATLAFLLDPHNNPVSGGAYLFPARADDLRDGEFWQGQSAAHSPAGGGVQLFGYDMGVVAYDAQQDGWDNLLPGGSINKNEDYRVWGKRIYAMADGTVHSWEDKKPNNPNPPADLVPPDDLVEGNGSLNKDLMSKGTSVKAGDFLGFAGNSGNSSGPHLHIHATKGTAPWQGPPSRSRFGSHPRSTVRCFRRPARRVLGQAAKPMPPRCDIADLAERDRAASVASRPVLVSSDRPAGADPQRRGVRQADSAGSATYRGAEGLCARSGANGFECRKTPGFEPCTRFAGVRGGR